jgi:hypothetical protein
MRVYGAVEVAPGSATIAELDLSQTGMLELTQNRETDYRLGWGYAIDAGPADGNGGIMAPYHAIGSSTRLLPGQYTVYTTVYDGEASLIIDHETIEITAGNTTACTLALPEQPETNRPVRPSAQASLPDM